ncbi:hypothetical protein [Collinsella sp. AF38-3AC]|uniref:hypothetical protein n=1 Tax=Collinsella sp. AF38-3AC TaxID=2292015 RepID=UPI000E4888BD|nr:hypothetical protein [Collinsella sp. AF38-3AC]RHL25525.1 hypothetical protein DW029_03610 [Collinsella sp. AF38-3AC]
MKPSEKPLGLVYAVLAVVAMFALICIACSLARPGDAGAADVVTVMDQSDGPLYDLPQDVNSHIATERSTNRAYIVVESDRGIAITPYLDENGDQVVLDRP